MIGVTIVFSLLLSCVKTLAIGSTRAPRNLDNNIVTKEVFTTALLQRIQTMTSSSSGSGSETDPEAKLGWDGYHCREILRKRCYYVFSGMIDGTILDDSIRMSLFLASTDPNERPLVTESCIDASNAPANVCPANVVGEHAQSCLIRYIDVTTIRRLPPSTDKEISKVM